MATEDKGSVPSEEKIGMPKRKSKWPNTPAKWIKLLGIPLTILLATSGLFWQVIQFNAQQSASAQMQATQVAATQAQALDQQRQATLEKYFDDMLDLLLKEHLRTNSDAQALAQALTYTAVRNLDGIRKGALVRFLWGAGLINGLQPIISMFEADLSGAMFSNADMSGINLSGAILSCNDLSGQKVCADLSGSRLCGLSQSGQKVCADLSNAYLEGTNLSGATLGCSDQSGQKGCANLSGAHLEGTKMNNKTYLTGTLLRGASYNTKPWQTTDALGVYITLEPTQWPQGFDPKVAGAICDDC